MVFSTSISTGGESRAEPMELAPIAPHCKAIITFYELIIRLEKASVKLQQDKLRRSKRKRKKTKWISLVAKRTNDEHKQAWLNRMKHKTSDKLKLIEVNDNEIKVEISANRFTV